VSDQEGTVTAQETEQVEKQAVESHEDDFLAGVQAADAESFNVCISCD